MSVGVWITHAREGTAFYEGIRGLGSRGSPDGRWSGLSWGSALSRAESPVTVQVLTSIL